MASSIRELIERIGQGKVSAVARAISILADRRPGFLDLLAAIYRKPVDVRVVGITGPPGAGKSTLVDALIAVERKRGRRVGVVAVDPSSPFTGGALLGDRLRMQRHATDSGVFIRSLASRGLLGGLGPATAQAARILGIAGYSTVLIETVGVGQAEVEVMGVADLVLMVLVPGSGDEVQALKAGVMEIGDIFVVNKGDRDGADRLQAEVEMLLRLSGRQDLDRFIARTVALSGDGVEELVDKLDATMERFEQSGELGCRRRRQNTRQLRSQVRRQIADRFSEFDDKGSVVESGVEDLCAGRGDPVTLAKDIVKEFSCWLGGER